jgi:hypothetical protein
MRAAQPRTRQCMVQLGTCRTLYVLYIPLYSKGLDLHRSSVDMEIEQWQCSSGGGISTEDRAIIVYKDFACCDKAEKIVRGWRVVL